VSLISLRLAIEFSGCGAVGSNAVVLTRHRFKPIAVGVRDVSGTIFVYCFVLGLALAGALGLGYYTGFLLKLFTNDIATQEALKPLLILLIVAQPLNSFVFAADGVLQGASVFAYQAKSMVLSVLIAFASFFCLEYFGKGPESESTLVSVWYSLLVLQLMRGITSLWKLVERNGPIDLFHHMRHGV
jgi:Na+-driven multidrug efflux pump